MSELSQIVPIITIKNAESSLFVTGNTMVSVDSIFSDSIWKMRSLVSLPGVTEYDISWSFDGLSKFFSVALADFAFARLYKPVKIDERMASWLTVRNELVALRSFAKFCDLAKYSSFDQIDEACCKKYLDYILHVEKKSSDRVWLIFSIIYKFWEYRSSITYPLKIVPIFKSIEDVIKKPKASEGNKTSFIPEEVFSPLMAASLEYVNNYSKSIISAWDNSREIFIELKRNSSSKVSQKSVQKKLAKMTAIYLGRNSINEGRKINCNSLSGLYSEAHILRTACTLVILAFSGMRASEVLSLRKGCCSVDSNNKLSTRYYINAQIYKHRGVGSLERWVVIEEVHKAVQVLETLTKHMRLDTGDDRLLISDGNHSLSVSKLFLKEKVNLISFDAILAQINRFSKYCNHALIKEPIPDWPNRVGEITPWKFNSRQFRRTLARYIARQPFGVIAGMMQYKHHSVSIFEGYAGTEPEWNKMLTEEKVLAEIDILSELAIDISQSSIAGEFGKKLKVDFEQEFKGRVEDFPPSQIAKWLANNNKELYVGKFNFCFFDPTKALCTNNTEQKLKPILNLCSPDKCANACVSKRHIPLWKSQLMQAEDLIAHPQSTEYQRFALAGELNDIRSILDDIKD